MILAHIVGIPVEENLPFALPAILFWAGVGRLYFLNKRKGNTQTD